MVEVIYQLVDIFRARKTYIYFIYNFLASKWIINDNNFTVREMRGWEISELSYPSHDNILFSTFYPILLRDCVYES